jgi:uncharacterized membrane protein YgaE (UPF0421/DUF939 family)
VAFLCLAQITGLPNQLRAVVISTAPSTGSPGRFPFERAASLAVGSCLVLLFFWLIGVFPGSRYITGTLHIAIHGPFLLLPVFMDLRDSFRGFF